MRGKLFSFQLGHDAVRIIPAHAGQTCAARSTTPNNADHPRACGANIRPSESCLQRNGSSPRMRGKRPFYRKKGFKNRIIPAHAGQTWGYCNCSRCRKDHPRACGANEIVGRFGRFGRGSSPRMRGKRGIHRGLHVALRIIPAHAGQTSCQAKRSRDCSDHPRTCGANRNNTI